MSLPETLALTSPLDETQFGRSLARFVAWALPHGRWESRIIGLIGAGIVMFIGTFAIVMLQEIEDVGRNSREKHAVQLVNTAANQFGTILYIVDQALRHAGDEIEEHQSFEKLDEQNAAGRVPVYLLRDFFFADTTGHLRTSAMGNTEARAKLDVSNRDYFRVHVGSRSLDSYVGRPIVGRIEGTQLIPISRAVRRPNGELMGVLAAMMEVQVLERLWQDVGLGPDDTLKLIGEDGTVWLHWPITVELGDADEPASESIVWTRHLAGWPMQLVAGVGLGAAEKQTAPLRRVVLMTASVGSMIVAVFGFLLAKRTRQVVRQRDLADTERATAAEARDLLRETIEALPAGVVLYDSEDRLLLFNSLAATITPAFKRPDIIGTTYEALARENAKTREAEGLGNQDEWLANAISRFHNKDQRGLRQLADGRWIEWYEKAMPSGGTVGLRIDVTELKTHEIEAKRARDLAAAERATAAEARDLLRETIETLPAGVVLYDSEDRLLLFNSLAATITPALKRPGVIGTTYEALARENAKTREAEGLGDQDDWIAIQLTRFQNKGERGLRHLADGRWIEMYEQPTPSGGTVGLRIDVTELKTHEIEARRARDLGDAMRARLTAAIDAVPVEFIEFDRDDRMILANRAARVSQGWIGEPVGKSQRELLVESLTTFRNHENGARFADGSPEQETWIDNRVALLQTTGTFDFTRWNGDCGRFYINDMPSGGRVTVRVDITELKRREEQLAAEMELLNSLVQSTGALVLMLDGEGRIVLINRAMLEMAGLTREEAAEKLFSEMPFTGFEPDKVKQWHVGLEAWRKAASRKRLQPIELEFSHIGGDGERRLFRLTSTPVQDQDSRLRYIVMIGVDDTERREGEIRLFDAARLSNLGEMATGIAHEINQPLAVIRLATESLREELDMPEAASMAPGLVEFVKQKLDRITGQTERASGIVRNLRTVARKPSNDALPFDLAEAARLGGDLLQQQLKVAGIEFTLDLPTPGPMVIGEASRLQQVLINLVLNARDALIERPSQPSTGTLGHIVLKVAVTPAGEAVLTVEDDGPGIPERVLPRLFEPFFTTKPTGKGTGLGLSISRNIITGMGGKIAAANRPEGGARFQISLPAAKPQAP